MALGISRGIGDIVAEVKMSRTNYQGTLLLVEGPSDSKFIKRYIDPDSAQIVICDGKTNAVGTVNRLNAGSFDGLVAFVDEDFDPYIPEPLEPNIVKTDSHDTETMLLSSSAFPVMLGELGDQGCIHAFEAGGVTVIQALIDRATVYGKLRYLNDVAPAFHAEMGKFSPWKYVDLNNWTLDSNALEAAYANEVGISVAALQALMAQLPNTPPWSLVQGHDAMAILCIGLKKVLGKNQVSESDLSSALRLAYHETCFVATRVYSDLRAWEVASPTYRIFP